MASLLAMPARRAVTEIRCASSPGRSATSASSSSHRAWSTLAGGVRTYRGGPPPCAVYGGVTTV